MGDSSASASGARNSTTSRSITPRSSARSSTRSRSSGAAAAAAAAGRGSNHPADGGGQDDSPSSSPSSSSRDAGNDFENFRSIEFGVVGWEEKDETHYTAARYRNSNSDLDSQEDNNTDDNSPKKGGRRKSAMPHHKYDSEEEDGDKVEEAKEGKSGRKKGRRHTDIPKTTPATTATNTKTAATATKHPQMNFNFISQDSPTTTTTTTARNSTTSNTDITADGRPSSPFIQFSHDKLYGRDKELQHFQSLYQRMIQHNQSQAVFLSAYSGSGKTRLVYEAVQRFPKTSSASSSHSTSKHPLPRFVHGKHEVQELDAPVPYKALSEAFQRWHVQLSETEQAHLHRFLHEELYEAVGDDVTVLGEIIPSFRPIIGSNSADGSSSGGKGTTAAAASASAVTTIMEGSHMRMGDSQATLYFDAHDHHHDDDEHDHHHDNNAIQTQRTPPQRRRPPPPPHHHHHHHHRRTKSDNDDVMNKSRLHYVFVSFLRCLCTRESPLVIYIDDLQWADAYTLELLETILSDPTTIQHIFFIGAYRSNEVNPHDHPLAKIISSLQDIEKEHQPSSSSPNNNNHGKIPSSQDETMQQQQLGPQQERQKALHIETIELSDLSKDQVGEFIADTLQLEVDQVQPLTEAIYRKTLGNIFFTKQALEQLVRRNALYFDMVVFQWQWRLPQDKLEETLSDDIVEMIQSKIECLPMDLQHVLAVAAHTRSSLDVETLVELLNAFRKYEQKEQPNHGGGDDDQPNPYFTATSVQELLEHAVMSGLLCRATNTTTPTTGSNTTTTTTTGKNTTNNDNASTREKLEYAFAHDRIREAARVFVTGEKLHKLSFIIGKVLAKRGTDDTVGEDWMMFTAIHHLNSVPSIYHEDEEARLTLAKLNLITAKLAMGRAAFEDAAKYAEKGIEVLPVDRWEQCTVLCHELYALAAEACRLVGNIQQMERYCAACLTAERDRPLEANYQVYYTLAVGLFYGSDRYGEAKDILLTLLKHLDCRFPTSPTMTKSSTMLKVGLLVATKNSRTEHEIEKMELMTDPTKMRAMKLLDRLFDICYIQKDDVLMTLVIFRALEYTLKFGLCAYSPRLVASVCCIFTGALNDLKGGGLYANYSRQLLKRVNHKPSEAGTMLLSYVFGSQWVTPIRECIEPLRSAHRIGLHTGAVENACWCMYYVVFCSFQAGRPLQPIAAECKAHAQRMEDFGQRMISLFCKAQLLTLLGIMGISKDEFPLNLSEVESNVPIIVEAIEAMRRFERTYNGEYELVAESTVKHGEAYIKNAPGIPQASYDFAVSGVSCLEVARKTGKPEYLREAKRIRKWINGWAKQGSPNFQHWKVLLDAGFAAQKGNVKATVQNYQLAVELATDGGYIHDAALANELWAAFALDVLSDEDEAQLRLHDAIKFYAKWGALGKVQRIKAKYPTLFQQRTSYASNAG